MTEGTNSTDHRRRIRSPVPDLEEGIRGRHSLVHDLSEGAREEEKHSHATSPGSEAQLYVWVGPDTGWCAAPSFGAAKPDPLQTCQLVPEQTPIAPKPKAPELAQGPEPAQCRVEDEFRCSEAEKGSPVIAPTPETVLKSDASQKPTAVCGASLATDVLQKLYSVLGRATLLPITSD
jgi:hypothetical protein